MRDKQLINNQNVKERIKDWLWEGGGTWKMIVGGRKQNLFKGKIHTKFVILGQKLVPLKFYSKPNFSCF